MKHKLTREAFKDLLAVTEAHCPRPNNCKTTGNQLLEFVTQSKGHVVKHYFCSYCKAYYGKDVENGGGICVISGQIIPKSSGSGFFRSASIKGVKKVEKNGFSSPNHRPPNILYLLFLLYTSDTMKKLTTPTLVDFAPCCTT